jgi:hypothetical protein
MTSKCTRKLTLVMMEFFILILLKVQAIDLSPTSFSPSGRPILYSHSFELDEVKATIHTCFADGIQVCERTWPHRILSVHQSLGFEACLFAIHAKCWVKHHPKEEMSDKYFICICRCMSLQSNIGSCVKKCYPKLVI